MARIAVLGAGAWGTALAAAFCKQEHSVLLWGRDPLVLQAIRERRENPAYLPGMTLPSPLSVTDNLADAVAKADLVLAVTPAQTTASLAVGLAQCLGSGIPVIACAKGIETGTGKFQTDILAEHLPENPAGVLSGPSFAADVVKGLPTAVSLAFGDHDLAIGIAKQLSGPVLRLYPSDDPLGVQLGGALKNVLAIAIGICRGGGMGASAEAALIARGYQEIVRLATAMGARPETLTGLSGLGDLVLTCSSETSRNFSYGIAVGRGDPLHGLKLAEGVHTVGIANEMARKNGIDCPVMQTAEAVLAGQMSAEEARITLMSRPVRSERA